MFIRQFYVAKGIQIRCSYKLSNKKTNILINLIEDITHSFIIIMPYSASRSLIARLFLGIKDRHEHNQSY